MVADCDGSSSAALCLTACNLGCTDTGCELTEIAQNQPLIFAFSKDIDVSSANEASISLRTSTGEEPVGRYLVNRNTVTFLPEVRPVGATTFFGFDPGAVYDLRIEAGTNNLNALRSTSGDPLSEPFSCKLRVTLGVIDVDGLAPRATLISPRFTHDVDTDVLVRLQFSEIIDVGAFFGTNAGTGPIRFLLRSQKADRVTGELLGECDPETVPVSLAGAPRVELDSIRGVTNVTYRSPQELPGNRCYEIVVTDRVRDLAGTPARLQTFHLFTAGEPTPEEEIVEEFKDETNMDRDNSSGTWAADVDHPDGRATFGRIGGDGRHGPFRLGILQQLSPEVIGGEEYEVYRMDVDNTLIPGTNTLEGRPMVVPDGVFHFSSFVLPELTKLVFRGSHPPQFHVRGLVQIDGLIELRGSDVRADYLLLSNQIASLNAIGQSGGAGAAGAGDGGKGGDKPDGTGPKPEFNGQDGEAGSVLAGHAYAGTAANTGGKGSHMHPTDGVSVSFNLLFGGRSGMVANGGGGGGHVNPGEDGAILAVLSPEPGDRGPAGAGGAGFPPLLPLPAGSLPHEHFLISGGGGGGGGGHPMLSFVNPITWKSGGGGAGGGGAILLRAGHRLVTGANSQILVSGGSGGDYDLIGNPGIQVIAPGGGGSGGSVVMQCGNSDQTEISGYIDVRGGTGTTVEHQQLTAKGGDGSDGLVRVETPLPLPATGTVDPAVGPYRTGELQEFDSRVAFQSTWYPTGLFFPPEFLHYTLEVEIDGNPVTYSDDPTVNPGSVLAGQGEPVVFRVQGALLDPLTGEPDPLNIRPQWRYYVGRKGQIGGHKGLVDDSATGFRFFIMLDRSILGPGHEVVVNEVRIAYKK